MAPGSGKMHAQGALAKLPQNKVIAAKPLPPTRKPGFVEHYFANAGQSVPAAHSFAKAGQRVSVAGAAHMLRVSEETIDRWLRQGVIPTTEPWALRPFNAHDLLAWARHNRIGGYTSLASEQSRALDERSVLAQAVQRGKVYHELEGTNLHMLIGSLCERLQQNQSPAADHMRESLVEGICAREAMSTTAIGGGVALPHPRNPQHWGVGEPLAAVCFPQTPIDWAALDGRPVFVFFLVICATVRGHMAMLSQVSRFVLPQETRAFLEQRPQSAQIVERIRHDLG